MIHKELIHLRNIILYSVIVLFYIVQVAINIFIEGVDSVFPPAYLFILDGILLCTLIFKKVNPFLTMYLIVTSIYIYFYFLLNDSPYLVNYLFMWLGLPLSAIYQNYKVVLLAGTASTILTFYSFFTLHQEIFPNVGNEDLVYLVLFGLFSTVFLLIYIKISLRLWLEAKEANLKLKEIAYFDPLTGAANRILLKSSFEKLKSTKIDSIAILFIDMNNFKSVNDTYGHDVGDFLLGEVVSRIKAKLRDSDLLCRLGGDEFVLLIANIEKSEVETVRERIHDTLAEPIEVNGSIIHVSASIGLSFTTESAQAELEEMLKEADIAMYTAKNGRMGTVLLHP